MRATNDATGRQADAQRTAQLKIAAIPFTAAEAGASRWNGVGFESKAPDGSFPISRMPTRETET